MDHPTELELVEWAAGRLEPDRAATIQTHLAACDACRRKADAQRRAWNALGDWQIRPPARDLWPSIEARLRHTAATRHQGRGRWYQVALRAAAAILLAGALGHLAGRFVRSRLTEPPTATAFAEALHLDALGSQAPVGLTVALDALARHDLKEDVR